MVAQHSDWLIDELNYCLATKLRCAQIVFTLLNRNTHYSHIILCYNATYCYILINALFISYN
jgi:hypothetical protein